MSSPRIVRLHHPAPLYAGACVRLDPEASHHAIRVLRLAPGDAVELFGTDDGLRWPATVTQADARAAEVQVGEPFESHTESPLILHLAQALPSGDKMDWVVEKAVELGVSTIQPLFSARTVLRLDGARADKRLEHWRRIATAACMQCGRDRIPTIAAPLELRTWLGRSHAQGGCDPASARWMLSPRGERRLASLEAPKPSGWLLVGPEGGLDEAEEALAEQQGWQPLRLGPRVLRTETAALAALAALQALYGDL
jgi:16S rRNA (uracil1498-N3)-methyltransferase